MKFLEYCKKHKTLILILGVVLILIPPILIHILFSIYPNHDILVAKWSAGELLNYFGSIIGAIATIAAVVTTIIYTKHQQDEQNILETKPYLQSKNISFNSLEDLCENAYNNYSLITIQNGLTMYAPKIYNILDEMCCDTWEQFYEDNCVLEYDIRNIGAHTAIDIEWSLGNKRIMYDFALSKDEINKFIIIINKSALQNQKFDLDFEFNYSDVLSLARYSQKELIEIRESSFGLYFTQTAQDTLSSPKRIK